jgi:hypothetical protein
MPNVPTQAPVPIAYIWVDSKATSPGNGTADHPYQTINQAIKMAKPGTAIMVREGDYHENVKIPRTISGTDNAPIWLISADGPQRAHIIAADNNKPALVGGGTENFVLDGFWISGGKNGVQFSQNGFDFTDMIKNITVRNNVIDGFTEDGVKANGGNNVNVSNNVIKGGKDEGIDFVAVVSGSISNNEVSHGTGNSAGIFVKGGSQSINITGNYVHDVRGDGISAGGWVNYNRDMRPGYDQYQARYILIEDNRVEDVGKRPLSFFGAGDSVARHNYLEATARVNTAVYIGNSNNSQYGVFHSANITVTDNFITRDIRTVFIDTGTTGVTFANNNVAVSISASGAHISSSALASVSTNASTASVAARQSPAEPSSDHHTGEHTQDHSNGCIHTVLAAGNPHIAVTGTAKSPLTLAAHETVLVPAMQVMPDGKRADTLIFKALDGARDQAAASHASPNLADIHHETIAASGKVFSIVYDTGVQADFLLDHQVPEWLIAGSGHDFGMLHL